MKIHPVQYLSLQDNDILKEIGERYAKLESENTRLEKEIEKLEGDNQWLRSKLDLPDNRELKPGWYK